MKQLLIGGQALRTLGSDRHTDDVDYLINDTNNPETFIHNEDGDFINANGHKFFNEVWEKESDSVGMASPQALLELCAFSFAQHCVNFNFAKADAKEYDIKFLVREFGVSEIKIANKYMSVGELAEVQKVINSVRK